MCKRSQRLEQEDSKDAFSFTPIQIFAINKRRQLPEPNCESGGKARDFGHLLDFVHRLRTVIVSQLFRYCTLAFVVCGTTILIFTSNSGTLMIHCRVLGALMFLKLLQISGSDNLLGTSNIVENQLPIDLMIFKSVENLTVSIPVIKLIQYE